MKLVRKYAVGGITFTPYIPTPAGASTSSTSSTSSSSDSSDKVTGIQKEIISIVKENGIPADVTKFLSQVQNVLGSAQNLSSFSTFGGSGDPYSMASLLQIQNAANIVKYNNERMTDAKKRIYEKDSGSEMALTQNGSIYCLNKSTGALATLKPEELFSEEGKKQFAPIDNATLIQLRERYDDPLGLAYNTSTLNDVARSISINDVYKSIQDTLQKFGDETEEHYTKKERNIRDGLNTLIQEGPDGYYKIKDTTQRNNTTQAITYLWNTLTPQAQHLVEARMTAENKDPKNWTNRAMFLLEPYMMHTKESHTVDFDKSLTDFAQELENRKLGIATDKDQLTQNTYLYRVGALKGTKQRVRIAPTASKIFDTGLLVTTGITNGAVVDNNMKRIGDMSIDQFLQEALAVKAADASTITLGNRVLETGERKGVMFNSEEECYSVLLPVTYKGGKAVPDFDVFTKFNKLQNIISNSKYQLPRTEIDRIAKECGLSSNDYVYDEKNNMIDFKNKMWFLQFGAIVSDKALDLSRQDKLWLEELNKSESKWYKNIYESMVKYGKMTRSKSDMKIGSLGNVGDLYKGIIYMAMPDAFRAATMSLNEWVSKFGMNNFDARTELKKEEVLYQQAYPGIGQFKN